MPEPKLSPFHEKTMELVFESEAMEVLCELVSCDDTYKRLNALHEMGHGTDYDANRLRTREAMERARSIAARAKAGVQAVLPAADTQRNGDTK